ICSNKGPAVARGKRVAAGLRRLPHGPLPDGPLPDDRVDPCCPLRLPTQEVDVPAVAPLTPSSGLRYDSPTHHDSPRHYDSNRHYPPGTRGLLEQARQGLLDAEYATHPVERYAQAHLAALRAAAAVLAARTRPRRRAQPTSAWTLLTEVAPELAEWSTFFAAASSTRAAAEAGVHRLVTNRDADDMVRQAGQFLILARRSVTRTVP
ncbi:MAG: SAV_6107 family HEPN domain-containing protein, partial [Pseudonocardiaceae bacterium]